MSHLRMILGEFDQVAVQAKRYSSVRTWRRGQAARAAAAMTVATAPPFILALPATVAASVFAVRKLAHAGWGVGVLLGVPVDPRADLLAITELWLGRPRQVATTAVVAAAPAAAFIAQLDHQSVGGIAVRETLPKLLQAAADRVLGADLDTLLPVVAGGAAFLAVRSFSMRAEEFYARRA